MSDPSAYRSVLRVPRDPAVEPDVRPEVCLHQGVVPAQEYTEPLLLSTLQPGIHCLFIKSEYK